MRTLMISILAAVGLVISVNSALSQTYFPKVVIMTEKEMQESFCKDVPKSYTCNAPVAMYANGVIFLRENYELDPVQFWGMILHEFVHHMQHELGMLHDGTCKGTIERMGYAIQEEWLNQNGKEPTPGKDFPNGLMRMMIESCGQY